MNKIKICFLIFGYNQRFCEENLLYIQHLSVPENVEADCITILDADNPGEAFNAGMHASDAQYKVYVNENVLIVNPNFIQDILHIFASDQTIGAIGVLGYQDGSGGLERKGSAIVSRSGDSTREEHFGAIEGLWEEVLFIEENLIVTAQDTEWQEYDRSIRCSMYKSEEFRRRGLISVVPKQEKPWCLYDNDLLN